MSFKRYLYDFTTYLAKEKQVSTHTVSSYSRDITRFLTFIGDGENQSLNDCEYRTCRQFLQHLSTQTSLSAKSVARCISALRSFWKYLKIHGHVTQNPWILVPLPKIGHHLPDVLTHQELVQFLENLPLDNEKGFRLRVICELLFASGLRVSELVGLNIEDIDFESGEIRVLGKGNKERITLFGGPAKEWLRAYLFQTTGLRQGTSAIFLNHNGTRLTSRSVQRDLKSALEAQGIFTQITPHTIRHSFATELYNGGADLRIVQELLGHKSLSTTQIYTHLSKEKLAETFKKAHPRGE